MAGQDGAISIFVVVVTIALVAVAALVLDGGRLLAARRQAQDIAANAARAGAQAVDEHRLRAGRMVLDPVAGNDAVARYLARTPATGTSTVSGDTVTVEVRLTTSRLLPLPGLGSHTVTATQRARAVQGVTTGDT